jgi:hypothetical protein
VVVLVSVILHSKANLLVVAIKLEVSLCLWVLEKVWANAVKRPANEAFENTTAYNLAFGLAFLFRLLTDVCARRCFWLFFNVLRLFDIVGRREQEVGSHMALWKKQQQQHNTSENQKT